MPQSSLNLLLQALRGLHIRGTRKVPKPRQLRPKRESTGKGLTYRKMVQSTPKNIQENARYVKLTSIKRKRGDPYSLTATTTEPKHAHEHQPHYQTIQIVSGIPSRDPLDPKVRVKISCTCSYYKFFCEYALYKQGAADIIYSNGEPAYKTNPGNIGWTCKHHLAIFRYLLKRYKKKIYQRNVRAQKRLNPPV